MIGPGAGVAQDAIGAAGIGEAAPHRFGKILDRDIVRAGSQKQEPARGGEPGGKPGQLAVAAQRRRRILFRAGEGRRIGNDDVEALAPAGERSRLGEHLAAAEGAALLDGVLPRRGGGQCQRRLGAVDAEHRLRSGMCRADGKSAGIAIQVEHPRLSRWSKNQPVFCPASTSASNTVPFSSTTTGPQTLPSETRVSSFSPSNVRAGLSLRSTIAAGDRTLCNASRISGSSRSMPAAFACTTSTSPKRSTTRPGRPSASAWTSR